MPTDKRVVIVQEFVRSKWGYQPLYSLDYQGFTPDCGDYKGTKLAKIRQIAQALADMNGALVWTKRAIWPDKSV